MVGYAKDVKSCYLGALGMHIPHKMTKANYLFRRGVLSHLCPCTGFVLYVL